MGSQNLCHGPGLLQDPSEDKLFTLSSVSQQAVKLSVPTSDKYFRSDSTDLTTIKYLPCSLKKPMDNMISDVKPPLVDSLSASPTPPHQWDFYGCSHVQKEYEILNKLGEGTFGEVHKARQKSSGAVVALKRILLRNEKEGFPITALREIRILKSLDHENILALIDMSVQRGDRAERQKGSVYMVSPYMDHDLAGLLANPAVHLELSHIKCYLKQLLNGINYLHHQNYMHRDIKTANILIDNKGNLLIADFGLARHYDEEPPRPGYGAGVAHKSYTAMVVTRWYRPPELVLGESRYTSAIDMWGIGCVLGEMFRRVPILQGTSDIDQGHRIFQLLGSPNNDNMPGWDKLPGVNTTYNCYPRTLESVFSDLDDTTLSLLSCLLTLNPQTRYTAQAALGHPFFETVPLACNREDLPQYKSSHEIDTCKTFMEHRPSNLPLDKKCDISNAHNYSNISGHHPQPITDRLMSTMPFKSNISPCNSAGEYNQHFGYLKDSSRPAYRRQSQRSAINPVPPYMRNRTQPPTKSRISPGSLGQSPHLSYNSKQFYRDDSGTKGFNRSDGPGSYEYSKQSRPASRYQ